MTVSLLKAEDRARGIGAQHGKNAAAWCFDGNTSRETYAAALAGLENIDPMIMDRFREPSLSGEYSDDYSERELAWDLEIDREASPDLMDECANAYLEAASSAFWQEVERMCRYQLGE